MPPGKKVLLFTSKNFDAVSGRKALRAHANVTEVGTLADLVRLLSKGGYDALFCGWEIAGGTWHDALNAVQQRASELPVVVVARLGGEKQWVEVLGQGAFDMIAEPYQMRDPSADPLEHAAASKAARAHSPHFGNPSKAVSDGRTALPASPG